MTCPVVLRKQREKAVMMAENKGRFVAVDIHKHYVMVGAVNAEQAVVLAPCRVTLAGFGAWAKHQLQSSDQVVLEATTNVWPIRDLLEPLVARIVVVHPNHVKVIAMSSVKTDQRDTLVLARLLAANLLISVWTPPAPVRELRRLVNHRRHLVRQRSAARNRLHSILHTYNLEAPKGDLCAMTNRAWWDGLPLPCSVHLLVEHDLALID